MAQVSAFWLHKTEMWALKSLDCMGFCWLLSEQWVIGLRASWSLQAKLLVGESDWTGRHHSYRRLKESGTRELKVDKNALMLEFDEAARHPDEGVAHHLGLAAHPDHDHADRQTPVSSALGHCWQWTLGCKILA